MLWLDIIIIACVSGLPRYLALHEEDSTSESHPLYGTFMVANGTTKESKTVIIVFILLVSLSYLKNIHNTIAN